jgi:hypothetical protein
MASTRTTHTARLEPVHGHIMPWLPVSRMPSPVSHVQPIPLLAEAAPLHHAHRPHAQRGLGPRPHPRSQLDVGDDADARAPYPPAAGARTQLHKAEAAHTIQPMPVKNSTQPSTL